VDDPEITTLDFVDDLLVVGMMNGEIIGFSYPEYGILFR